MYSTINSYQPINWVTVELVPDIFESNSILMWLIIWVDSIAAYSYHWNFKSYADILHLLYTGEKWIGTGFI
jgi:hypothetical protein